MTVTETTISERAAKLHESAIVIDALSFYYDGPTPRFEPKKLTALNVTAAETYSNWAKAVEEIMTIREDLKRDQVGTLIRSAADIRAAKQNGRVGIILGVQSSLFVETELWHLELLHDIGLRIFQLTYNERSYMGDGCLELEDGGLTRFGKKALHELHRLGIALDLSHVGRRTSLDAIAETPGLPMFSHANPDALTKNPRNLIDEQIRGIGDRGGMIGVCTWAPLCWKNDVTRKPTTDDIIDHVVYVADMIGIDHVGIGTDSACTDNKAWLIQHSFEFNTAYPEIATEYISHHGRSEDMPEINSLDRITDRLLARGFSDEETLKVIGGNFLRHFEAAWRG